MRHKIAAGVAAFFLLGQPAWAADKPEEVATRSAESWLSLVDQGRYVESWDAAAKLFRSAVGRDQWKDTLEAVRAPLGKLLSRSVRAAEYKTSLPGAPDGRYVVIQYTASFENKKEAVETVTPLQKADGSWRVSGYFIK